MSLYKIARIVGDEENLGEIVTFQSNPVAVFVPRPDAVIEADVVYLQLPEVALVVYQYQAYPEEDVVVLDVHEAVVVLYIHAVCGVVVLAVVVGLTGSMGMLAVRFPETCEIKTREEFH